MLGGYATLSIKNMLNSLVSRFGMHIESTLTTPLLIAFHAELGASKANLTPDATIKFETVKQNFGNAYDPLLGYFNCPTTGLYFFTYTIMLNTGKEVETNLVVNGSPIAYTYSAGPPTYHNAGSTSVVTYLHTGDKV